MNEIRGDLKSMEEKQRLSRAIPEGELLIAFPVHLQINTPVISETVHDLYLLGDKAGTGSQQLLALVMQYNRLLRYAYANSVQARSMREFWSRLKTMEPMLAAAHEMADLVLNDLEELMEVKT